MTLYVDYGNDRHEYKIYVPATWEVVHEQRKWCEKTFKQYTWHYYDHQALFYFKRERDKMIFLLRWGT